MKTIKINLIGDLGKASKTGVKEAGISNSSEAGNQILAYILVVAVLMVFAASFGGWMLVRQMTSNLNKNLANLQQDLNSLREEETKLSEFRKSLKKEKEITELKVAAQKQFNSSFLPWSGILREIASNIPKDIIILKIEKQGSAKQQQDSIKLNISGIIPSGKKPDSLTSISLFIFNLNENPESLLSDAKITKLDFNDKTRAYEFEIETSLRKTNEAEQNL